MVRQPQMSRKPLLMLLFIYGSYHGECYIQEKAGNFLLIILISIANHNYVATDICGAVLVDVVALFFII